MDHTEVANPNKISLALTAPWTSQLAIDRQQGSAVALGGTRRALKQFADGVLAKVLTLKREAISHGVIHRHIFITPVG